MSDNVTSRFYAGFDPKKIVPEAHVCRQCGAFIEMREVEMDEMYAPVSSIVLEDSCYRCDVKRRRLP